MDRDFANLITPRKTKLCKICGEEIKISVVKCIHCNGYQNWRSRIDFSSNVLSLLVALIAVATAAIPVARKELQVENSNLAYAFRIRSTFDARLFCF